jgi:hypothetical protein
MVDFKKKGFARAVNEFAPKTDVGDALEFVKSQKVPGEFIISLPGNGGIASIIFREKEHPVEIDK